MTDVPATWQRIENWLAENAPELHAGLPLGATEEEIVALETQMEVRFPDDFRESLQLHNGETTGSRPIYLIGGESLCSLKNIFENWDCFTELLQNGDFDGNKATATGPVKPDWWNVRWIPITSNGGGDHICLDVDPASGGRPGQVIQMWHDWGQREVLAESFTAWLSDFADDLEEGCYHAPDGFIEEA